MATKGDVSTLNTLKFGGKPLIPLVSSFSGSRRNGVVQSDVTGGAQRQRKKYYGTTYLYQATFYLRDIFVQDYIKSFFELNEGKKFICHLRADRPTVEPYVVQVVSDWQDDYMSQADGALSVTLEVFSVRDRDLDETLVDLYGEMGDTLNPVTFALNELVEDHLV